MTESWQKKLSALKEVPVPRAMPLRAEPIMSERSSRPGRGVVLGAVAASLALLAAGAVLLSNGPSRQPPSEIRAADLGNGWAPPSDIEAVSLSAAQGEVRYDVVRPQDELASDSSLQAAYVDPASSGVRLDYASGVIVILTPWPEGKDAAKSYRQQWAESGGLGTLETINGHPAWILPGDAKPTAEAPGGGTGGIFDPSMNVVELTVNDLDVVIAGHQPVNDLVAVAASEK